jgi:hypothetical protein
MSMDRMMGGEGAALPWVRRDAGLAPGLVVCPMFSPDAGMDVMKAQEIYRLAYERAQAMLRPSAYEMAQKACWN